MESLFGQSLFTRSSNQDNCSDKDDNINTDEFDPLSAFNDVAPVPVPTEEETRRVTRPLNRRTPTALTFHHTFFKPVPHNEISPVDENAPVAPTKSRKRKRPLLTELFHPHVDGDLSLYEQHARYVRSFFVEWSQYVDGDGPLPRRLLIVSGPPGSGKTSSVDVLARKYGFRLLELEQGPSFGRDLSNATSTARESTGEIPKELLEGPYKRHGRRPYFTDKKDDIVWDSRPACVYLDSDGLSGGDALRFIRDVTNAAWKAKRPMVLVCNNRFGPVPMELRQKRFTSEAIFRRPPPNDLRKGILRLADRHSIDIPRSSIDRVLEVCQGDIRASLTALQFSFVNSASRDNNTTTAMSLFNDKKPLADLDQFMDLELSKLYERVFDYSLDTDVCWDMDKIKTIGEWNALTDFMRLSTENDHYLRASLNKYRQLFKTGKLLQYKPAHNDFETIQKVREVVSHVQADSSLELYRGYSKLSVLLELIPLVGAAGNLGRSPKQETLEHLAHILYAIGVRSIGKVENQVVMKPDISILSTVSLPVEIIPVFEVYSTEKNHVSTTVRQAASKASTKPDTRKNWLKPTDTQIQASRSLTPGVWLDFKISDENQAKRGIGLRDLFT